MSRVKFNCFIVILIMLNNNQEISIQQRTENFALRVIKAYSELSKRHFEDGGKLLSKQFLRSDKLVPIVLKRLTHSQIKILSINILLIQNFLLITHYI